MKGETIEIWGEHRTFRDLVYVKDVVSGFIQALNSPNAKGLYNLGSGEGLTIDQEAKIIVKVFSPINNPSKIVYRPDIEEVLRKSFVLSIEKAKRDFGYAPKYTYETAMRDYREEMISGRFKHLIVKQEKILMQRFGMTVDDLLKSVGNA